MFSLVLLGLSIVGVYFIFRPKKTTTSFETVKTEIGSPTPTIEATESSLAATPTPTIKSFTAKDGLLSFSYPSYKKFYEEKEKSGLRYVLYDNQGIITIHEGTVWSWNNPGREMAEGASIFEVEGKQKLIDFENGEMKYTLQCVHNNIEKLKEECEQVWKSIKTNTQ